MFPVFFSSLSTSFVIAVVFFLFSSLASALMSFCCFSFLICCVCGLLARAALLFLPSFSPFSLLLFKVAVSHPSRRAFIYLPPSSFPCQSFLTPPFPPPPLLGLLEKQPQTPKNPPSSIAHSHNTEGKALKIKHSSSSSYSFFVPFPPPPTFGFEYKNATPNTKNPAIIENALA